MTTLKTILIREIYKIGNCHIILWTDKERQWEKAIPILQQELPELLVYGVYEPIKKTGPAIWLRCAITGKLPGIGFVDKHIPIIYLPGVSKQDLRAVESCPEELKPLVELQFRGTIWSQYNGKDWTILSFLISDKGGLGLDVAQDNETKKAMQLALIPLLDEYIDELKGKHLDKDYFNSLLTGGDTVRDMLNWLDHESEFRNTLSEEQWQAFSSNCKSMFNIDPEKDGLLGALKLLADSEAGSVKFATWGQVWTRFCDSPDKYPNLPNQIRKIQIHDDTIFWMGTNGRYDHYPQWNDDMEDNLKLSLQSLVTLNDKEIRNKTTELEKQHGKRRDLVWAELGMSKYSIMLKDILFIADNTGTSLDTGTIEEIQERYADELWQVDMAVLELLAKTDNNDDHKLVNDILDLLYLPWLDSAARYLQQPNVFKEISVDYPEDMQEMEAVLFVDGLRFDCAKKLLKILQNEGYAVTESSRFTGFPTITSSCKPIVVKEFITEPIAISDRTSFAPISAYDFKKMLEKNNWIILNPKNSIPSPSRNGGIVEKRLWMEYANLDTLGHAQSWKLAKYIDNTLAEIMLTVNELVKAGWNKIQIVTDHGWLLYPGGLPKSELSNNLTESKWPRFATIKEGANTEENIVPWYWDNGQNLALADGVSCYRNGEEYTHGGLSIQECLLLDLTIIKTESTDTKYAIRVTDIKWVKMRCSIALEGQGEGLLFDIRKSPADPLSSIVLNVKSLKFDRTTSVVVEDENLQGSEAYIVIHDKDNNIVSQILTTVSGGLDDSTG